MNLPIVNVFSIPYESWTYRTPSIAEMLAYSQQHGYIPNHVKDNLVTTIYNHVQAAIYMASKGADTGLERHINDMLARSHDFKTWRRAMPSKTPKELADLQKKHGYVNLASPSTIINNIGSFLSSGQYLFHGGQFPSNNNSFKTIRPFSTTFCPQVALRNAEHRSKAYDAGYIDLLVLRVINPKTSVFVYRQKGTTLGHEKEVVFSSGAELKLKKRTLINNNYLVGKLYFPNKMIPVYVVEVDIS